MDVSAPNASPGRCGQCRGSGVQRWGPSVNGVGKYAGACNACRSVGHQGRADIARNHAFYRHQLRRILASGR
jgi:DnaJ-class molecular chaperone